MDSPISRYDANLMITNTPQMSKHVFVNAFARLHMGFFDLNGSQGRRFGSLGLGLDSPDTLIELALGSNIFGPEEDVGYVNKSKQLLLQYANVEHAISVKVHREIPRHFGLGSGTQMALALGAGINQLLGLDIKLADIANITGRGLRSGIGIGTFASGGLVLDGGKGSQTKVPPIIAQHAFPASWRVLLIFDHGHIGVHGEEEVKAFASLKDADIQKTQALSHHVLMKALPAVQEHDLKSFGEAISLLQAYTGDYFSPVQGGRYASKLVTQILTYLTKNNVLCIGQSSWGPTGFAVFESAALAEQYLKQLQSTFPDPQLSWLLCRASNVGASVNVRNEPFITV